jgi:hypothetical protein
VLASSFFEDTHPTLDLLQVDVVRRISAAAFPAGISPLFCGAMLDEVVRLFLQHKSHNLQIHTAEREDVSLFGFMDS